MLRYGTIKRIGVMADSKTIAKPALEVNNLSTWFYTDKGIVRAANDVSFTIKKGETLGLVGESGCGKSVTARSILGLIEPPGEIVTGEILLDNTNLLQAETKKLEKLRGRELAMVFQDPLSSLNPVLRIGLQMIETIQTHKKTSRREAERQALLQLDQIGLPDPERIMRSYSFELSVGMCQRVMLAMALLLEPKVLIVDEPTTALDTTVQTQILAELKRLQREMNMSLLMITHDMGVIAQMADTVAVMYAGSITEKAPVKKLFDNPAHPYTRALLSSIPRLGQNNLSPIEGQPPSLFNLPPGCPFLKRCPEVFSKCFDYMPSLGEISPGHFSACLLANNFELPGVSSQ